MRESEPALLFPDGDTRIPRFREAGEVTLDLIHRDGRVEDCWLGLYPREFELFWRLAQKPGERMGRRQLAGMVPGPREPRPECGGLLALHVARVRAKLAPFGLARMIRAHARGGYFLDAPGGPCAFGLAAARPA